MSNDSLYSYIKGLTYKSSEVAKEELLDETNGVTVLSLISKEGSEELRQVLLNECEYDMEGAPVIKSVYQDFSQKRHFKNNKIVLDLKERIEEEINREIYEKFGFSSKKPLSFDLPNLQKYEYVKSNASFAIPPHVDYKASVEVIAVLLLDGPSLFHIADDRECCNERMVDAMTMDIILMRGYGFQGIERRPIHYVKKIPQGVRRVTLGFRMLGDNQEDVDAMEKALHGP